MAFWYCGETKSATMMLSLHSRIQADCSCHLNPLKWLKRLVWDMNFPQIPVNAYIFFSLQTYVNLNKYDNSLYANIYDLTAE